MTKPGSASGDWQGARLAWIAAVLLGLSIGMAPVAMASPSDDPGKPAVAPNGGPGPQDNPGSARAQEVRSSDAPRNEGAQSQDKGTRTRAHGAPGASKGRKSGASKGQKARSHGKGSEKGGTERSQPEQAKAGKTTICHSTNSETNPYVEITVSDNALDAHSRHHDGRDIIPAPSGGCPETTSTTEATGEEEGASEELGARSLRRTVEEVTEAVGGVFGVRADSQRPNVAVGGVLGAAESSPGAETASAGVAEEDEDGGSLPFTGLALIGILAAALAALAGGTAIRRASRV